MDKEGRYIEGLDDYIKSLNGEYSKEELTEMMEISHDVMQKCKADWHEFATYTRIDVHPDPEGSKMGRPI